ncbi:MAG: ferrous iron transport protein B [Candidatus Hydrogenedentes bacterium]|nr:ferrous iron transport protein B [Candidatus Hydrogenedentota bacterium]
MSQTVALVGNPNVGKTAVFNALTGLHQHTGNYAGVTVERKHGTVRQGGASVDLIDLPGAYSLSARSPDEIILADVLLGLREDAAPVMGLLIVVDASNLERNLFFVSQLLDLDKPSIIALNMMDIARRRNIAIRTEALEAALGVPVVPLCARTGEGIAELKTALLGLCSGQAGAQTPLPQRHEAAAKALAAVLETHRHVLGRVVPAIEALRILVDRESYAEKRLIGRLGADFQDTIERYREEARSNGKSLAAEESRARYAWVQSVMADAVERPSTRTKSRSERIDNLLTHRFFGTLFFVGLMLLIFQTIYSWAGPLMDLVDGGIGSLGERVGGLLPGGMLQSLVVDGIFAGVGGVLVFLPQILLLSLFIALLEDCGYMSRAAFLMDRLLGWCGLSGQSFIPMLSSFACAVPGILATRTINNRRDRFTTILVAPLMSCSARLPVYLIMIAAFIPEHSILGGLIGIQAMALFLMYSVGVLVAVPTAWILKKTLFKGPKPPFILEMPSYKVPQAMTVGRKVYYEGKEFLSRAGTLIFAVTILVWALAYFPHSSTIAGQYEAERTQLLQSSVEGEARELALADVNDRENGAYLRYSFLGQFGNFVEPVFHPLGWDWRIATATIASFPAREIIVATLGTLFNLGSDEDEASLTLLETLKAATWPDGRPLFNIAVAFSIMVFFALCAQCSATLITIKRETGQWRWPVLTFVYMTGLAYVCACITYQTLHFAGLGG